MTEADALAIHSAMLVVDGLDCSTPTPAYAERLRRAGVGAVHVTIEDQDPAGGFAPFDVVDRLLAEPECRFRLAVSVAEMEAANAAGSIALVLGQQGADPVGVHAADLPARYERGLRITGIVYNTVNAYGGGCLAPEVGLTAEGRALVDAVGRLGMLLDVGGHTGERSSLEAIERSGGRPVICSHTGAFAVNPKRRNTSDRVCEAIAATGGVVGVLAVSDFMVRNASNARAETPSPVGGLDLLLDHLDHLRGLVGAEHVGIGPDFVEGLDLDAPTAWPGPRFTADEISPMAEGISFVRGFESIDELPNVTAGLLARGWPVGDVRQVLGESWLRVYRAAWGG